MESNAPTSQLPYSRRFWLVTGSILGGLLLILILFVLINSRVTGWVDGDGFRDLLNRATSKGLKIQGSYSPLTRVGLLGMHVDSFTGTNGSRTIVRLQANDVSGTFNPLGIGLRRWEIDNIHLKSGTVMLQKTEPIPGAPLGPTPIPWTALFWPYRVHLADVKVDDAQILWQLQEKESGIYHTFLEITPNGRDYEYDARGGELKTPMTPPLQVEHAHLLIRKPRLYCPVFILGDDPAHPEQQLRLEGDAGLQQDRSMKLKIDLASLNVSPWFPEKQRAHILGHVSGHFDYTSTGTGLETAQGQGNLAVTDGILRNLAPVRQYVALTKCPDPGDLTLKTCKTDVHWQGPEITMENIEVECEGVFRLTGSLIIHKDKTITGNFDLGLTDPYIQWLPTAKEAIFTRTEGSYHVTTVHLSGTTKSPHQDLSDRVTTEVGKSPLLAMKLFFRQAGEWLNFD